MNRDTKMSKALLDYKMLKSFVLESIKSKLREPDGRFDWKNCATDSLRAFSIWFRSVHILSRLIKSKILTGAYF